MNLTVPATYCVSAAYIHPEYFRQIDEVSYLRDVQPVTFDLAAYGFDIIKVNDSTVIIPILIINNVVSYLVYYNLFYNGETPYCYSGELWDDYQEPFNTIFNGPLNEKEQTKQTREAS